MVHVSWLGHTQGSRRVQSFFLIYSPLLGDLILPLDLLLLKLSDVPHSNFLTELQKHLILHLENRSIDIISRKWSLQYHPSGIHEVLYLNIIQFANKLRLLNYG